MPPSPPPTWILAIDFGTSYTVAACKVGERAPEVLEIGGERRVPSVIMVDPSGTIVVGRVADDLSATHPESTLRALKNRLGDQAPVVLDGRPHQVVTLVAALLQSIYADAVRQMGQPPAEVRLTHPATWNRPRLNRLLEAAVKAGLPNPALVPEPVAAALSFASEVGVPAGAHVVVYDLGGGTFDTAVVTSSGGGFAIVGRPTGDQNIGGELFDEIIVNHLGQQLPADAWEHIQVGEEPLWQQVGATLRNEARKAKETLSGNAYADLIVPLPTGLQQIRITRAEFEGLVRPYVAETVTLLGRCVSEAGLTSGELAGISLVGGSSRSPIVEEMVKHAFADVAVIRRGDPKTAVAAGAARAVRSSISAAASVSGRTTQESSPITATESVRLAAPGGSPGSAATTTANAPGGGRTSGHAEAMPAPTTPVAAPAPGPPTSDPGRPPPPHPSSGPPTVGAAPPRSGSPGPPDPALPLGSPGSSAVLGGATPASATTRPPRRRRSRLVLACAALAVIVAAAIVALVVRGRDSDAGAGQPTRAQLSAALLPIRTVRDALGSEYNAADPGEGEPFCEQFALDEPTRERSSLFQADDEVDGVSSTKLFTQDISSYTTESGAQRAFDQDKAITANCESQKSQLFGVDVTYTFTDETRAVSELGDEVVSIKYVADADDGTADHLASGYIVVRRARSLLITTSFERTYAEISDDELSTFLDLTTTAFERADDQL